ncbi:MAG: Peptidase family protein [Bacteroidota bacterium]|nr:Peptidase family protein [Bacteroidota bacterium]
MKKILLLSVIGIMVVNYRLNAGVVTLQNAQTVAVTFYKAYVNSGRTVSATLAYTKAEADNTVDFYVFDINPKGFVIVSGDDNMEPVLGYSSETAFDVNVAQKKAIGYWMNQTAAKIYNGIQQHVSADARISGLWSSYQQGVNPGITKSGVVTPLVTTTWNQEPYYNQLCPFSTTDNQRAVTGCVATAMAQIMKFWNYPATGTGSYSYTDAPPSFSNNYGVQSANFGATTYNWAAMPLNLTANNTAVATLMYHCGVSVAMDYGDDNQGGSGAWVLQSEAGTGRPCAQKSYATYFGYNAATMQGVKPTSYTAAGWITLLENELSAGRPIQYEGFEASGGGHTWVCDGFDANNMFHMNWGWGGYDNGYFVITNLNPNPYTFNTGDAALIGIQPLVANTCNVPSGLSTTAVTTSAATFNWTAVAGATSYNVHYRVAGTTLWTSGTSASTAFTANGLVATSNYEWQVQTVCASGSSAFSASSTFTTNSATVTCGVPTSLTSSAITASGASLTWGAVSGATSYTIEYKSSSGAGWTTITGLATPTYNISGLATCTAYQFAVLSVCGAGSSVYSAAASFTTIGCPLTYCASRGTNSNYEYIKKISIGTISNTSGSNAGYGNFTTLSTNLTGGTATSISVTPGFASGSYHEYWTVYIDYNHNGVFTDAGEMVAQVNSTGATSKAFSVPTTALNGVTRMRVQMQYGAYQTNPCAAYTYGEVEDYDVNITGNLHLAALGETDASLPATETDAIPEMRLYPNPAQDNLTVDFSSNIEGVVRINVYNISGQRVMLYEGSSVVGLNTENINTNAFGSGVYIIELENNRIVTRQRFIVSK